MSAKTDEHELVNKMKLAYLNYRAFHNDRSFNYEDAMKEILSVVKDNLGSVAEICDCVDYCVEAHKLCKKCNGTGIVKKEV